MGNAAKKLETRRPPKSPRSDLARESSHRPVRDDRDIARYRLVFRLGQTNGINIDCAISRENGRLYALKSPDGRAAHAKGPVDRSFARECRLSLRLRHRNIVRASECFSHRGIRYLALEFIVGLSLFELLRKLQRRKIRVRAESAAYIVLQLVEAIAHLRCVKRGAIYTDLAPPNVMISTRGEVKLIDFGSVRTERESPRAGYSNRPRYQAPEHVLGERADTRADIFGAGLILSELLTGGPFFRRKPARRDISDDQRWEAVFDRGAGALALHPLLKAALCKCLAREPRARFASLSALRRQLKRYLACRRYERQDFEAFAARAFGPLRLDADFSRLRACAADAIGREDSASSDRG